MNEAQSGNEEKMLLFERKHKECGLSITPQRRAIFRELAGSSGHPTAAEIYGRVREYFPNISLNTVNNTLLKFHEIGLADVVEGSGDPKRFDPNPDDPHHHFRCVRCGKVIDFKSALYDALPLPDEIAERCVILGKRVHLDGLCESCREEGR